jgi:uncharacterized protein YneR
MRELCVYLSGGFHGNWRNKVIKACEGLPIRFLDPLAKEKGTDGQWKNIHMTEDEKEYKSKLKTQATYWYCDKLAVKIADVVFVYFESYGFDAGKLRGTGDVFEAGMAFALDKLVIVVNEVDHRYFRELVKPFIEFSNLDEGIKFLKEQCSWLTR